MTVTITRPVRRRPVFHPLPVAAVDRLTDDAVAVTFAVPEELRETFAFRAGQHLTVRRAAEDGDGRAPVVLDLLHPRRPGPTRPVADRGAGDPRRRVLGVRLRGAARRRHRRGAAAAGHFTTAFAPDRARHYGAVVAGSGITPVLSLVATALAVEPASTFTLVYGNRTANTVMFAEELADLKDRYPTRLHLVHVLSREPGESPLLSGRIDAERLGRLLGTIVPGDLVDEWFLCGPYGMVVDARDVLTARGRARVGGAHRAVPRRRRRRTPVRRPVDQAGAGGRGDDRAGRPGVDASPWVATSGCWTPR